jgi:hypothetical protein
MCTDTVPAPRVVVQVHATGPSPQGDTASVDGDLFASWWQALASLNIGLLAAAPDLKVCSITALVRVRVCVCACAYARVRVCAGCGCGCGCVCA